MSSRVFADTVFWIALANRNDPLHTIARDLRSNCAKAVIVTTDEVLTEFLNGLSKVQHRKAALDLLETIRSHSKIEVKEQSRNSFNAGLELYKKYDDKEFSLVDCISFDLMKTEGINDVLTEDHHFVQAGFSILMQSQ